jgi:hypothetical protein
MCNTSGGYKLDIHDYVLRRLCVVKKGKYGISSRCWTAKAIADR